jgi:hypothetical protein
MKLKIKPVALLLTISLFTTGVMSSFNSIGGQRSSAPDAAQVAGIESETDTNTYTGTDTGTGSEPEANGKVLATLICYKSASCPTGTVTKSGFTLQCLSNAGYCHSSTEKACDAPDPNCP